MLKPGSNRGNITFDFISLKGGTLKDLATYHVGIANPPLKDIASLPQKRPD